MEGLAELVEVLARCPATRVTLACADGFGADRYGGYYQRQGVEVAAGPLDWPVWCADRRYHYSHVLVSDEGVTTRLWPLVRSTQPQAMAVFYSERLPFRRSRGPGGRQLARGGDRDHSRGPSGPVAAPTGGHPDGLVRQRRRRQPAGRPGARAGCGPLRAAPVASGSVKGSPTGRAWSWWRPTTSTSPATPRRRPCGRSKSWSQLGAGAT